MRLKQLFRVGKMVLIFFFILSISAFALTADEHFDRASSEYLLGNEAKAIEEAKLALKENPEHQGAKELLQLLVKEEKPVIIKPAFKRRVVVEMPEVVKPVPVKILPKEEKQKIGTKDRKRMNIIFGAVLAIGVLVLLFQSRRISLSFLEKMKRLLRGKRPRVKMPQRTILCPECHTKNAVWAEFCSKCGIQLKAWSKITTEQKRWFEKQGWRQNPFTLDILPSLFTGYEKQVKTIIQKISSNSAHLLILGKIGVGKTTLLQWLERNLSDNFHPCYIPHPPSRFRDFIDLITSSSNIGGNYNSSNYPLHNLSKFIQELGKTLVLLLDEAHEFDPDFKKGLRTISDLDNVHLVLAGLPETEKRFREQDPALFDRIGARIHLDHLNRKETEELIRKRIEHAGGEDLKPLTLQFIEEVYRLSRGIPRASLKICDWAVSDAIRQNLGTIDVSILKKEKIKNQ